MSELLTNFGLWVLSSVIGVIILNVFSGIITEPIKRWLDNRSLVSRRKSISKLKKDLDKIDWYAKDINRAYMQIIWIFSLLLLATTYFLGSTILACITFIIDDTDIFSSLKNFITYAMMAASTLSLSLMLLMSKLIENIARPLIDYDKFKTQTLQRISELESKVKPNEQ